jgi:poly-beta-hydroxyalkanoate depolymerase
VVAWSVKKVSGHFSQIFYATSIGDYPGFLQQIGISGVELRKHGAGHPTLYVNVGQMSFEIGLCDKKGSE